MVNGFKEAFYTYIWCNPYTARIRCGTFRLRFYHPPVRLTTCRLLRNDAYEGPMLFNHPIFCSFRKAVVRLEENWIGTPIFNNLHRTFKIGCLGTFRCHFVFFATLFILECLAHFTNSFSIAKFCLFYGSPLLREWWNVTVSINKCWGFGITIAVALATNLPLTLLGWEESHFKVVDRHLGPPLGTGMNRETFRHNEFFGENHHRV